MLIEMARMILLYYVLTGVGVFSVGFCAGGWLDLAYVSLFTPRLPPALCMMMSCRCATVLLPLAIITLSAQRAIFGDPTMEVFAANVHSFELRIFAVSAGLGYYSSLFDRDWVDRTSGYQTSS